MQTSNRGFTTLTLTILLLAVVIVITIFTARFKLQEQRILRNYHDSREALLVAESALEQRIAQAAVMNNANSSTSTGTLAAREYELTVNSERFNGTPRGDVDLASVLARAKAAQSDTHREVTSSLVVLPVIRAYPDTPLAVKGGINVSGNFEVVANPNGGGDGVPLSIWTDGVVDVNGSGSTCGQQEFSNGECSSRPLSERGEHGIDILDQDLNFPDDLLDYLFGIPGSDWQQLRDQAAAQLTNCSDLGSQPSGLLWVSGNCDVSSNTILGSTEAPVILIVQDGDLKMNGGAEVNGLVMSYTTPEDTGGPYELTMNGGALVNGAVLANHPANLANGTLTVRFDGEVLANITNNDAFRRVSRVGGSWHDFR
ncbi:PilX N-terminal [Pseudidiomarina planktonica]|uniref:PilX N-terminal n=1 Tax=Pseudidiomarina planktonica TaxID=1323738 RepID=A0A1Y6EPM3_9GAMM|nr:PilX N-terminal domain-containing pilus assembly protein [Pseudidiomarina planktonica]RUO65828.1 hypothetical protein CWI77_05205 [Pseudidiomarina planktonica]SMQ62462.1 PilX N-terminal [Pseudidiomarina planktonica]